MQTAARSIPIVEGVYTADPRKIPKATRLKEITFDEMLELASLGAQVLNNRSVELAKSMASSWKFCPASIRCPAPLLRRKPKWKVC